MAAIRDTAIPSPAERKRRRREEMVGAILDASRAVMREEGVAALNLNEVARRLGMRTPSLYEYFPNKMAIYDALFVQGMRMYRQRMERVLDERGASWEGLQATLEDFMAFAREYPELYYLCFERPVPGFVPSDEGLREGAALLESGREAAERMIAGGQMAPGLPVEQTRDLFVALMQGLTSLRMANEPEAAPGEGRFGVLVGPAVELLRAAWSPAGDAGRRGLLGSSHKEDQDGTTGDGR